MFKNNKNTKQTKKPKGESGAAFMQQMGIQIPNFDDPNFGANDDDDDGDLEAELRQIQQDLGGPTAKKSKANQKKPGGSAQDLQSFHSDVNKLLSDIDRPINDDELSEGDEDDLLAELNEITGDIEEEEQQDKHVETKQVQSTSNSNIVSLLETRLDMYKKALETAKTSGDASKVRRYDRQHNLIKELLQSARAGAPINESEIPPAIGAAAATPSSQPTIVSQQVPIRAPSPPPPLPQQQQQQPPSTASLPINNKPVVSEPPVPTSNNSDEDIARFRSLALKAKAEGDMVKAKEYLVQMKNLQSGTTPNSTLPPPPPPLPASAQAETHNNVPEDENSDAVSMPLKAPEPRTVMEALQQRHEELVKRHQEALSKGDNSKARRMDRLTKQYQEAIDCTRKGRPFDYSELPDLPGFAPIPVQQPKTQPAPTTNNVTAAPVKTSQSTVQVRTAQTQQQRPMPPTVSIPQPVAAASTNTGTDQSVQSLRLKHEQFKKLALQARQKGDMDAARKYVIEYKKLEQMIASAESDLPIDTNQAFESPGEDYDMIRDNVLTEEISQSNRETIYIRLQEDLLRQVQLCARNQQMYAQMEGPNNMKQANDYKRLEQRCARDLEQLKQNFKHGLKVPVFHYEKRQMNVIHVNNDLTDNEFEVTVVRGINLQVPSGYSATALETYVIVEFPYPPETSQTARTRNAIGSINAEYLDSLHKFQIKRNDTKLIRLMNRKELKLSIFYKAGFLRSDRQLGTASIKLSELERTATIHESVDVYENDHKKKAQGKLEVKIRIKEALGRTKSSELLLQQWLVIDRFEDIPSNTKPSTTKSPSTAPSITAISCLIPSGEALGLLAINLAGNNNNNNNNDIILDSSRSSVAESNNDNPRNSQQLIGPQSIQVLKYEADVLQEQIEQIEDHLTPELIEQLRIKHRTLEEQIDRIVANLREGGKHAVQEHIQGLEQLLERYIREEDEFRQRNDIKKADLSLNKKNLVSKEIETFIS